MSQTTHSGDLEKVVVIHETENLKLAESTRYCVLYGSEQYLIHDIVYKLYTQKSNKHIKVEHIKSKS